MQHCVLVVSGLVVTVMGPFKNKKEAQRWIDAQQIKSAAIIPILSPGDLDEASESL